MNAILSTDFWKILEDCLRASQPLVVLMRLVDSDEKPVMGHIAHAFFMVKKAIQENFGNKESAYKPILDIIKRRWTLHFDDRPLIGAGAFLNPKVYYYERDNGSELADFFEASFQQCVEKMVSDPEEQNKIMLDVESYKQKRSRFASELVKNAISRQQPSEYLYRNSLFLVFDNS
jgi:hypothetical protein